MNIWILNHYALPPSMGGLNRHYYFSKFLSARGHAVKIFTSSCVHNTNINMNGEKELINEQKVEGVDYTFVHSSSYSGNGLARIKNMLEFPLRLAKVCKCYETPDVIYASSPDLLTAAMSLLIAKKRKVPCVVEIRDLWPESIVEYGSFSRKNPVIQVLYMLEKWIYKKADRLIFTISGGYDYIKERGWQKQVPEEKVFYINNGVDLDEFSYNRECNKLDDPDLLCLNTFKVVYTGSIRKVNNLMLLVDAARQLKNIPEIQFIIYGDGDERAPLQQICESEGIINVHFKGQIEKKYIPFVTTQANVNFINVQQTDIMRFGCSLNKLFDYLAAGKPVLSNLIVAHDLLLQHDCGIVTSSQRSEDVCSTLVELFHMSEEKREKMGENARLAAKDYDYRQLAEKLEDLLEDICLSKRAISILG